MEKISAKDCLRLKGILAGKPLIGPRVVNIHLTNVCNVRCCFCWYHSPLVTWNKKREDLDFPTFRKVVDDCASMGVDALSLEGGEVVRYPHAAEAFHYVKSKGLGIFAYTNLAYGREHLKYIAKADRLYINLSASDEKMYQKIHGMPFFKQVEENLKILREMRKQRGHPSLQMTFIINKLNYHAVKEYLDWMNRLQVDNVSFRIFEATVEMKSLILKKGSSDKLLKVIDRVSRLKCRVKHNLFEIREVLTNGEFLKNPFSIERGRWNSDRLFYYNNLHGDVTSCYTGWFYSLIDEKGRVIAPCDNIGICVAGNIYDRSFKDIWFHSQKFKDIRRETLHSIDITKKRWAECRYCGHAVFNREIGEVLKGIKAGGQKA
ncbi:MAG: radical SAM protein [Candidatus Omnitrophica bacterium]|nr:radical SAM protein [Candidatus Omnitrophota bacterium]